MPEDSWELLSRMANITQLITYILESEDLSNSDIAKELDKQNTLYFKQILENQNTILKRLDFLEDNIVSIKKLDK